MPKNRKENEWLQKNFGRTEEKSLHINLISINKNAENSFTHSNIFYMR